MLAAAAVIDVRARRTVVGGLDDFAWAALSALAVSLLPLVLFWFLLFLAAFSAAP